MNYVVKFGIVVKIQADSPEEAVQKAQDRLPKKALHTEFGENIWIDTDVDVD